MLLEKIENAIRTHRMLQPGDQVLIAVSGGPDSVALCHLLHRLSPGCKVKLMVAHIHHGLRGDEADQDAGFVQDLCLQLGLPVMVKRVNVRSWREQHGGSLQMAARALRYSCLFELMAENRASKIALGHNADDQAEEILLRIFRGTGQRGLAGMPPSNRDGVIRPLLDCHRHEIITYLENHGLAFRQDRSNLKPWCQRNLLRLELLPKLQQEFNSNLSATLLRTCKIFRDEEDFWERLLQSWLKHNAHDHGHGAASLPLEKLLETHPAMQKRLLRRVVQEVKGDLRGFGFHHTEILLNLCRSPGANRQIDLPGGLRVEKSYNRLTFALRPQSRSDFFYELSETGDHPLPLLNRRMELRLLAPDLPVEFSDDPMEAVIDLDRISFPLVLRSSMPGDRFRPLGLGGSKKLKDFFIDAKVTKSLRRQIPILCSKDHIVWVVGYRLDDRVKITSNTTRLLRLRYLEDHEQE